MWLVRDGLGEQQSLTPSSGWLLGFLQLKFGP